MPAEIDGDDLFRQAMELPQVKAKVHERATKIASRTRRDLARAEIDATVEIVEYHTPSGRASLNIRGTVKDPSDKRQAARIARRAGRAFRR
ncbi:hypothetical protein [Corynebacterium lipophiloflavum]|uniref:Uncharacterized protein n=1 Tax=Corynebacterium lipophiloflavum (strain ATCC 700352 / DSM 44291 / CCUG 37336 / JCM 10383 / DMMZ 1944) TaxID=525263 RepID=C0XU12_CORLD|nr:hypothetical protein [Corynebacterium lipophiloflavum]EEI16274.1 hypothetical protein HMPREF0298_1932 [Corynebacterium lipophiloflavum DSM 44291]